jgi:hypothetical protein
MKNIFIKSIYRQPIRIFILTLLIGIATFAAVLRATEFVIVRNEINRIEGFYRGVGSLVYPLSERAAPMILNFDDLAWYDIVAGSPYVEFADRRRIITGYLNEGINTNLAKSWAFKSWEMQPLPPGQSMSTILLGIMSHYELSFYHNTAYFYGTLLESRFVSHHLANIAIMYFMVDEVILGYPEHIKPGHEIRLGIPIDDINNPNHPALAMREGGQYLLRGAWNGDIYELISSPHERLLVFRAGGSNLPVDDYYALTLLPLESGTDTYFFPADNPGLDTMLTRLERPMFDLYRNMRSVQVITSMDMTAMFSHLPNFQMSRGRLLTYDDYINANPVVVINQFFADRRGISIGDTLSITLQENMPVYFGVLYDGHNAVWDYKTHILELEVVGTYNDTIFTPNFTELSTFLYVPQSIIPPGFAYNHIPTTVDNAFTFVLHTARYVEDFYEAHQEALSELGYSIHFFVHPEAPLFFRAADNILFTMTFNLVLFSVLVVVIVMLGTFIYLLLMRRSFAILRSMGYSARRTFWQMVYPIFAVWVVAIVSGAVISWRYAVNLADDRLAPVYNYDHMMAGLSAAQSPSDGWLVLFSGAVVILVFVVISAGGYILASRPVLRLLQGRN